MKTYELCIDLGSGFISIYKKGIGVVLREPTLALIDTSSKNMKVVKMGREAMELMGKISDNEVFVSPIIEGVIKNPELAQKILSYCLTKVVKYKIIKPSIRVIALLPIGLKEEELEDYKRVFYGIGFSKIDFVYNELCVVNTDSTYFSTNQASLVVNIGAGKTEIATVVNNKIINAVSLDIGGNLIDRSIVEHLQRTKGFIVSQNVANKLKENIGSLYQTDKSNMEINVQDSVASSQISAVIRAKDIFEPISDNYFKIMQAVLSFYTSCTIETAQDIKNVGVIFYGGGSLITGIENFFKKGLDLPVFVLENPQTAAVLGSEKFFSDIYALQKAVEEN